MIHDISKFKWYYDISEVSRCLLYHDPLCTKACPEGVPAGDILRSLFFRNYSGADRKLSHDCSSCDAPCEKAIRTAKKTIKR